MNMEMRKVVSSGPKSCVCPPLIPRSPLGTQSIFYFQSILIYSLLLSPFCWTRSSNVNRVYLCNNASFCCLCDSACWWVDQSFETGGGGLSESMPSTKAPPRNNEMPAKYACAVLLLVSQIMLLFLELLYNSHHKRGGGKRKMPFCRSPLSPRNTNKFNHGPLKIVCVCRSPPTHHAPHPISNTHNTQAPLQAAHVEGMNTSPHDEPKGKPVLRRPASGGGVIISSTPTNTSQTNKKAAYGKGGTSSLPGGSSLRVQRQQHQHRSLWMTCSRCLCGTRAEEWGSKLRQFLVGELPPPCRCRPRSGLFSR